MKDTDTLPEQLPETISLTADELTHALTQGPQRASARSRCASVSLATQAANIALNKLAVTFPGLTGVLAIAVLIRGARAPHRETIRAVLEQISARLEARPVEIFYGAEWAEHIEEGLEIQMFASGR